MNLHDFESPEALAWAELQRRGSIPPRYLKRIEREVAAELARCLEPVVHEQAVRPYGAIVARDIPHIERLGRVVPTEALAPEIVQSLADGKHAVMLLVAGHAPQLLLLNERMSTEQDYAAHAVWVDGVIVCNDGKGVVRIVTDSSITVVEGRRWTTKHLVYEAAEDIVGVVPAANPQVVRRLLELVHHRFSPKRIGVTLLYALTERATAIRRRDAGIAIDGAGLSILNRREEPIILHLARYRDGAVLIGHDGRLLAVNVILRPTRASEAAVPSMRGTRHTSAARHTYDCPEVLAFVVSADGPVTVFSDGRRIADLKASDPPAPPKTLERIDALASLRRVEGGKTA